MKLIYICSHSWRHLKVDKKKNTWTGSLLPRVFKIQSEGAILNRLAINKLPICKLYYLQIAQFPELSVAGKDVVSCLIRRYHLCCDIAAVGVFSNIRDSRKEQCGRKQDNGEWREGVCHCGGAEDQREGGGKAKVEGGDWLEEQSSYHPTPRAVHRWFQGKECRLVIMLKHCDALWCSSAGFQHVKAFFRLQFYTWPPTTTPNPSSPY